MKYKEQQYFATVEGGAIVYEGEEYSPSSWANKITGSQRNAWRDIWIREPRSKYWIAAGTIREQAKTDNKNRSQTAINN